MNPPNVPPSPAPSKPVPSTSRQSQALVADARQRMAARKARSAQTLAAAQDRTVSYLMRKACEQYVETQQKKAQKDKAA
jgi:hypothetical protein